MRDTRVRLYSYSDAGTNGDILPTYTFVEERWGRVEAPSGRASAVAGQQENTIDAVIALPRGAQASRNGLAKAGTQYYKITALLDRRLANEVQLLTVFADDATFTVVDSAAPVVVTVDVSPAIASLAVNATQQFTATPKDSGGNPITGRAVQWLSGDPEKASITADGLLTALASGTVDVLAIVDGVVGTAVVTVGAAPGVQRVTVSPTSGVVPAYGALSFAVAPLDASGNIVQGRTVTAVSSDPTVATVSVAGYVVTVSDATAAGLGGEGGSASITVTVDAVSAPAVPVTVTADPLGAGNTPLLAALGVTPLVFRDVRRNLTVAGGVVSSLADVKGDGTYGPAWVQPTGTKQPTWDGTTINCDGVDDFLVSAAATPGVDLSLPLTFVDVVIAPTNVAGKAGAEIGPSGGIVAPYVLFDVQGTTAFFAAQNSASGGTRVASTAATGTGDVRLVIYTINVAGAGILTVEVPSTAKVTGSLGGVLAAGAQFDSIGASTSGSAPTAMHFRARLIWSGGYTPAQRDVLAAYAVARHNAVLVPS